MRVKLVTIISVIALQCCLEFANSISLRSKDDSDDQLSGSIMDLTNSFKAQTSSAQGDEAAKPASQPKKEEAPPAGSESKNEQSQAQQQQQANAQPAADQQQNVQKSEGNKENEQAAQQPIVAQTADQTAMQQNNAQSKNAPLEAPLSSSENTKNNEKGAEEQQSSQKVEKKGNEQASEEEDTSQQKASTTGDGAKTSTNNKSTKTQEHAQTEEDGSQKEKDKPASQTAAEMSNQHENGLLNIKKILNGTDQSMFIQNAISRSDGLLHLLYSDVSKLLASIANDFPDITKVYSIGQSNEGRDIMVLELSMNKEEEQGKSQEKSLSQQQSSSSSSESSKDSESSTSEFIQLQELEQEMGYDDEPEQDKNKFKPGSLGHTVLAETNVMQGGQKPAILLTGATHAREMISTSMVVFEMLKIIQLGYLQKDPHYQNLLQQNKYFFMPIFNVDGSAFIEQSWVQSHKIPPKRKNTNSQFKCAHGLDVDGGVDLNRNFGIDFGQIDDIVNYQGDGYKGDDITGKVGDAKAAYKNPCNTNFAGPSAFSEPETVAFKNFLTTNKDQLAFVINIHSNGNAFIYPFNGRQKNDIEERRPGIMQIFTQIANEAPFPSGTMKGTSKEVMGLALGGDQDDWTLDTLGIPSVTAELGYVGQFIDEWQLKDTGTGNEILREQSQWMEYIFQHLPEYGQIVANQPQKKEQSQEQPQQN